jgi:hypothetical protein
MTAPLADPLTPGAPRAWVVAVVASVLAVLIAVNSLRVFEWDATAFIGFGEEAIATRVYAEEVLGPVELRRAQGHDGKFFFVQAIDPWVLDPARATELLEPPVYRSQRMLYPVLAGFGGLLGPEAIVWGLLIVNVLGLAIGTWATAKLSNLLGASAWWGLAFAANAGLIFDLQNSGAGIVAACLAMVGVLMLYEGRYLFAIAPLAAAVLAREVMLVTVLGLVVWHWGEGRRRIGLLTLTVPGVLFGSWYLYLVARLGSDESSVRAFSAPFVGMVQAIPAWTQRPANMVAALAVISLMIVFVYRWWYSRTALGWAFVGFVPLALVLSDRVWAQMFDFSRALAPGLTAAVLLIFIEYPRRRVRVDVKLDVEATW